MKTFETEVKASILGNMAYSRLSEIVENDLGKSVAEVGSIHEAKFLLAIEEAISTGADFLQIRIRHESAEMKPERDA